MTQDEAVKQLKKSGQVQGLTLFVGSGLSWDLLNRHGEPSAGCGHPMPGATAAEMGFPEIQ